MTRTKAVLYVRWFSFYWLVKNIFDTQMACSWSADSKSFMTSSLDCTVKLCTFIPICPGSLDFTDHLVQGTLNPERLQGHGHLERACSTNKSGVFGPLQMILFPSLCLVT